MNAKRVGAAVLAIVLVAGAFLVRRFAIDDDDGGGTSSSADELVCITELTDACRALAAADDDLDVTIEPAGSTLDRLAALDDPADAPLWLTVEPYPAMVDALRAGRPGDDPVGFTTTALGASQLAIALPDDGRLDVLLASCGDAPVWRCIGDVAGDRWDTLDGGREEWGTVRPAFGDVADSALGLASFAAAVAGYFDDPEPSRSDWEGDDNFRISWLRGLVGTVEDVALSGGTALATMATRPAALDVAATADYEVAALGATADQFARNYPRPEMWLQAVLAAPAGVDAPAGLAGDAVATLAAEGWDPPDTAATPLPGGSTMLALRALWEDAT